MCAADTPPVRHQRHRILASGQLVAILGAVTTVILTSRASDWTPVWLVGGLLAFAILSDSLALRMRGVRVTGAFSAVVLAMVLLGPGPAVLIGTVTMTIVSVQKRLHPGLILYNLFTWSLFPVVGGLIARSLDPTSGDEIASSALVLGIYVLCNVLNFVCIWGYLVLAEGQTWRHGIKDVFLNVFPVDLSTGFLVLGIVYVDRHLGPSRSCWSRSWCCCSSTCPRPRCRRSTAASSSRSATASSPRCSSASSARP